MEIMNNIMSSNGSNRTHPANSDALSTPDEEAATKKTPTEQTIMGALDGTVEIQVGDATTPQKTNPSANPNAAGLSQLGGAKGTPGTTPEGLRRKSLTANLSGHAGSMWNAFVHRVPHPHWMEYRDNRHSRSPTIPRLGSAFESAADAGVKKGELAPLAFSGKFAGGLRADIKRRAPWYLDDWIEPLRSENRGQALAACIFLFFACLSPAVTFGMLFSDGTDGQLGVVEMLLSSGLSGVFYAALAGQPLAILGATGPELAYTVVFYRMCQSLDIEFLPARCWEGLWTALFTTLMALFDVSALMKHVTRFTEEIFSALISTIFIVEALVNVFTPFFEDFTIEGRARSFMGCTMCFGTFLLATWCKKQRGSRLFTPMIRNMIANYGVTIAIVTFTLLSAYGFSDVGIATLQIPTTLEPTYNDTLLGRKRDWVVNPMGTHKPFPVWAIFFTALPALGLTILGYLDQNLTSLLINRKDHNLRKPPGYHLDLFVCGAFVYPICSLFGLPFTHAATVRSMTHLIALSTRETVKLEGGGTVTKVTKVIEGRTTHMAIHLLLLLSVALAPLLQIVPKAVLYGVFLFMGVGSMAGNQLFDRIELLFIWRAESYPKYAYVQNVQKRPLHLFTIWQLLCFGVIYGMMKIDAISVGFPFMIGALIFVRFGMQKCWTKDALHHLDE